MAKIKLKFTEEQLRVISSLSFDVIRVTHSASGLSRHVSALRKAFCIDADKGSEEDDPRIALLTDRLEQVSDIADKSAREAIADEGRYFGIDTYALCGATSWYTAMSLMNDDAAKYGGFDFTKYPQEVLDHYEDMFLFIVDNLKNIGQLVFQMSSKGGLKADVTYVCLDHQGIWYEESEFDKKNK